MNEERLALLTHFNTLTTIRARILHKRKVRELGHTELADMMNKTLVP